mmetsp:Transcript_11747/g.43600  ORF Transcript_11747/g.43600 Transcript_11747/m.43600 type:complete len:205 (-) Transcript_11747:461-1075(-)
MPTTVPASALATYIIRFAAAAKATAPANDRCPFGVHPAFSSSLSSSSDEGTDADAAALPCACRCTVMTGTARVVALTSTTFPPFASVAAKENSSLAGNVCTARNFPPSLPSLMDPTFIITPEGVYLITVTLPPPWLLPAPTAMWLSCAKVTAWAALSARNDKTRGAFSSDRSRDTTLCTPGAVTNARVSSRTITEETPRSAVSS